MSNDLNNERVVDRQPTKTEKYDQNIDSSAEQIENKTTAESVSRACNAWDSRFGPWAQIRVTQTADLSYPKLQSLSMFNEFIIVRQFKLFETTDERLNRYIVKTREGENVYYAIETCDDCSKDCCCGNRSFTLTFYDINKQIVIYLERPLRWNCCPLIPCCFQKMLIWDGDHELIGIVQEKYCPLRLVLDVNDDNKQTKLRLFGPLFSANAMIDDIHFNVHHLRDKDVAEKCAHICKKCELMVGGHIFAIKCSTDLDVKQKAYVIACTILIDYYYYEQPLCIGKYESITVSPKTIDPFPLCVELDQSKRDKQTTNK